MYGFQTKVQLHSFVCGYLIFLAVFVKDVTGQRIRSNSALVDHCSKINRRQVMVGKKRLLLQEVGNLGRWWWINVSKTIFPIQAKLDSFKGEGMEKREGQGCNLQEKQVPRQYSHMWT